MRCNALRLVLEEPFRIATALWMGFFRLTHGIFRTLAPGRGDPESTALHLAGRLLSFRTLGLVLTLRTPEHFKCLMLS